MTFANQFTVCPRCNKFANGVQNIDLMFGFRLLRGVRKPQSHCRACRTEELQLSRRQAA